LAASLRTVTGLVLGAHAVATIAQDDVDDTYQTID
jgi:hypothetical protein